MDGYVKQQHDNRIYISGDFPTKSFSHHNMTFVKTFLSMFSRSYSKTNHGEAPIIVIYFNCQWT